MVAENSSVWRSRGGEDRRSGGRVCQHPVGLVEGEDLHAREIHRPPLQVIEQAAGVATR
jgi:hypothetical protein